MKRISETEKAKRKARHGEAMARISEVYEQVARVKMRDALGIHITVWVGALKIDWWPSTGKYLRGDQHKAKRASFNEFVSMLKGINRLAPSDDFSVIE